jgi:hypothetical protein
MTVMDVFKIDEHNGASSSHVAFPSSFPLFFLIVLILQIKMMKILLCHVGCGSVRKVGFRGSIPSQVLVFTTIVVNFICTSS